MRGINVTLLAGSLLAALAGCSEATGPSGGDSTVRVAAIGDDASASQQQGAQGATYTQALSGAEGTVTFRARVYVRSDAGTWVSLTERAAQQATVDASGRGGAQVFATSAVSAGSYSRVRVEFEEVRANVTGGIRIGAGLLSGTVRVDLEGDNRVVVEREVDVRAEAGATTQLLVNLNADAWLRQASAQSQTVSEAAFQSAVAISAR